MINRTNMNKLCKFHRIILCLPSFTIHNSWEAQAQSPGVGIKAGVAPLHASKHPEVRIQRCRTARAAVVLALLCRRNVTIRWVNDGW